MRLLEPLVFFMDLQTSMRSVSSHVGTGTVDDNLSSGMDTDWCLGLGVVFTRCLPSFAKATCHQGPFDHKFVACTFPGKRSPWC